MIINLVNQKSVTITKGLAGAMALLFILLGTAYGDPSEQIKKAMYTPASIFDVFLLNLYESTKCPGGQIRSFCMQDIEYNFADNLIQVNFSLQQDTKMWEVFLTEKSDEQREERLKGYLYIIANELLDEFFSFPKIRHGYVRKGFDPEKFIKEILQRTVINIRVDLESKIYSATRDHHGKMNVDIGPQKTIWDLVSDGVLFPEGTEIK